MSSKITESVLLWIVRICLYALPFTLLLVSGTLFFPYITLKNFAFRVLVEFLAAAWAGLLLIDFRRYFPKRNIILIAFSALVFASFLSGIFGVDFGFSFWSNFERMEGIITHLHLLLLFMALAGTFRSRKDWFILFGISIAASVLLGLYGLLEYAGKINTFADSERIISTLGNPLYVAAYLSFHIFLISFLWFYVRSKIVRGLLAGIFVFELIMFFFTGARGAFLGIIGGVGVMSLLWIIFGKGKKKKIIFGIVLLFLACIPIFLHLLGEVSFIKNNDVLSRFSNISISDNTVQARFTVWKMAFHSFLQRPLFGWGVDNFIVPFSKNYDARMFGNEPWFDRTHNVPLEWLVSAGIVGFGSYVFLMAAVLIALIRITKKGIFVLRDTLIFIGMFGAYLFQMFFVFDTLATYFMLVSITAFLSVAVSSTPEEWGLSFFSKKSAGLSRPFGAMHISGVVSLFIVALIIIIFINIKPYLGARALIDAFRDIGQGKNAQIADDFTRALSYSKGTIGTSEIREHLARAVLNVSGNPKLLQNPDINSLYLKAVEEMEKEVDNESPTHPRIKYNIILGRLYTIYGSIMHDRAMLDKAVLQFEKASAYAPRYLHIYPLAAEVLLQIGDAPAALQMIESAEKVLADSGVTSAEISYSKPLIYAAVKDYKKAEILLRELGKVPDSSEIHLDPDRAKNIVKFARTRWGQDALPFIEQIYKIDPMVTFVELTLAEMYEENGNISKARFYANEALKYQPSLKGEVDEFLSNLEKLYPGQ